MGLHVLVVDDDFINRKLLQNILKRNESIFEIIEAENGSEALEKVEENPQINMILLDIMMPVVNGIEFLEKFRANMKYAHIPVIVLSTDDSRKTEAFDYGADDFLRKPVKEDELFSKINQWLSQ
ncbi:MAG TPA: response regulator [Epsilonproteobacteria bacterium]|nr:response regulator [Campylobacterota bacterium]